MQLTPFPLQEATADAGDLSNDDALHMAQIASMRDRVDSAMQKRVWLLIRYNGGTMNTHRVVKPTRWIGDTKFMAFCSTLQAWRSFGLSEIEEMRIVVAH